MFIFVVAVVVIVGIRDPSILFILTELFLAGCGQTLAAVQ